MTANSALQYATDILSRRARSRCQPSSPCAVCQVLNCVLLIITVSTPLYEPYISLTEIMVTAAMRDRQYERHGRPRSRPVHARAVTYTAAAVAPAAAGIDSLSSPSDSSADGDRDDDVPMTAVNATLAGLRLAAADDAVVNAAAAAQDVHSVCDVNAAAPADLAAPTDLVMMPAELDADLSAAQANGAAELDSDGSDAQLAADGGDDNASVATEVVVSSDTRRGMLAAERARDSWMGGGAGWSEPRWR